MAVPSTSGWIEKPPQAGPLWWRQAEELFERMQQHCDHAVSLAQASASHAAEAKRLAESVAILVRGHLPLGEDGNP